MDNNVFGAHFLKHGIYFRKYFPDTPAQNGVVERKYHDLTEMVRAILPEARMPASFWVEAAYTVVFTINRHPTPNLQGLSPLQKLFHRPPDYNFLRTFAYTCFPNF